MRVEFVCGGRALRDLRFYSAHGRESGHYGLTVGPSELGSHGHSQAPRIQRIAHRSVRQDLMEQLAGFEAARLVGESPVVKRIYSDRSLADLRTLATAITERGGVAILGLSGEKTQIIIARPASSQLDCGEGAEGDAGESSEERARGQPPIAQGGLPDPSNLGAVLDEIATASQSFPPKPGRPAPQIFDPLGDSLPLVRRRRRRIKDLLE